MSIIGIVWFSLHLINTTNLSINEPRYLQEIFASCYGLALSIVAVVNTRKKEGVK
jgi:hypothetical protein